MVNKSFSAVWFRRDFRTLDHTALYWAIHSKKPILAFFVIDSQTLEPFTPGDKPRAFFFGCLLELRKTFQSLGSDLILLEGDPTEEVPKFCRAHEVSDLFLNKDYETYSLRRDKAVIRKCQSLRISAHSYKDHVLFEENEILNGSDLPYRVFTAYKNQYRKQLQPTQLEPLAYSLKTLKTAVFDLTDQSSPSRSPLHSLLRSTLAKSNERWQKLAESNQKLIRSLPNALPVAGEAAAMKRLKKFIDHGLGDYSTQRNIPSVVGTSRISPDLRAGTLSPRQVWRMVSDASEVSRKERDVFLDELIWREFFMMIGFQFPQVFKENYSTKFKVIEWRNDRKEFAAWCEGRTGYPIVDAGMRELVQTGLMHNRIRMVVATFLTKDLLIDWRWGEKFFQEHLIDGELAVNNGNWQWCASTGSDAQPYFRVFNPTTQSKKFDPQGKYIRRHVPELKDLSDKEIHEPYRKKPTAENTPHYPQPIVDHASARLRCLRAFKTSSN